jgi:beta-lactamase regulating signal transducer with metallopeptidase domain
MVELLVESALRSLALGGIVWLGLALLRVRNPHAHMTAWTVVLIASLAMPLLVHRLTLTIPVAPPSSPAVAALTSALSSPPADVVSPPAQPAPSSVVSPPAEAATAPPTLTPAIVDPPRASPVPNRSVSFDWRSFVTGIYALVAGVLLLRLFTGLVLTWRMARAARPIHESWTGGADVRVSDAVGVPVTFGSTVLLPTEYARWSPVKRGAVLSHEGSHVAHGDFYVLLLAATNRAVFWFNPFAWWQLVRLAELAEIISDDAALEMLEDRPSYADILLEVASNIQRAPAAIAMARACTVRQRIERILAGAAAPARMDRRKRALIAAVLAPVVAISAGSIAFGVAPSRGDRVTLDTQRSNSLAAHQFDRYVGHYAADPSILPDLVLTVTRESDHLFVQRTGQAKLEVFPEGDGAFFYGVIDQRISFRPDGAGLVLHRNGMDIGATRVDAASAKRAAELFDQRIAEQARPRTAIEVDPALFDRYVGYYELHPGSIVTISREGDKLFAQLTGAPRRRLFAASEREYFYKFIASQQITFLVEGEGPAMALVLHQNGQELPSRRVDEARARATEARARELDGRRIDQGRLRTAAAVDPALYDRYAGLYQRGPNSMFTVTREGERLFVQLTGQPKLEVFPESDREFFYKAVAAQITFVADGEQAPTALILHQNGSDFRAQRIAGVPPDSDRNKPPAVSNLDSHVGWYELSPVRALAVARDGERLVLQETGRPKFEVIARGDREFASKDGSSFVVFVPDAEGRSAELVLQEPSPGARRATRIDVAGAQAIEQAFALQLTTVPDRFKDQAPAEGSKDAVLRAIDELQRGAPSYDRMSAQLADNVRRQLLQLHPQLVALGAVESVFFRGVGPGGYDIYGAKFAKGFAEFRILVGPNGTTEDMIFRPDGDDTPGGLVACSEEQTLRTWPGTAPIKLLLYNASGADIRVFALDFEGKRRRSVSIGDDRSASIFTYIKRPWVVTDASGQCLEIIQPGHSTRYLTIEPPGSGELSVPSASRRTSPTPGSEDALRRYIDALRSGQPDYDGMTPEVAAETRRQLLLNQAILTRLGALRAMSFRGVTVMGSDLYTVHFANGSAEWRIGLVQQGRIGRVALGPVY